MTTQLSTLANGLRIATDRVDTVDTVSLGIWIDVGTRHEPAEINGVAHFLEHMAFKGTERRTALAIAEEIEAVGGHLNAYTSREHTAYYAKVLKEDAPLAVDIIFDLFQERAFPDQAMGRPVRGRPEIIQSIARETVAAYLHDNYAAPRMVLAAAGNIDHDSLVGHAERVFAALPRVSAARTEPAIYVGGELREQRDLEQVHVVLGFNGLAYTDPDHYAASVLSTALGGGMSSRLFQEIREKRGLVYTIYSFAHGYRDGGVFGVYAGTGPEEVVELIPAMCEEIRRVGDGLGAAELRRARAQLKAGILMSLESTSARCEQLAQHLLVYDELLDVAEIVARIEAVDNEAVMRVARRITATRPTFAALGQVGRVEHFDRISARFAH